MPDELAPERTHSRTDRPDTKTGSGLSGSRLHSRYIGLPAASLDGIADALLVADAEGRYLAANPAAEEMLGFGVDELRAMGVGDLVVGSDPMADFARLREEGWSEGVVTFRRSGHSTTTVQSRAVMATLPGGAKIGVILLRPVLEAIGTSFGEKERAMLTEAISLSQQEAEREHRIAAALQQALLPNRLPVLPNFELAVRYEAAGPSMLAGGDFYDAFDRPDRSWGVVVGDVCGKGPKAAAIMGIARHTIRAAGINESRPSAILKVLNEALLRSQFDEFCTACDVRIRPTAAGAMLTVCSAGHPLPIILRSDGTLEEIGVTGTLLGVFDDPDLTDMLAELRKGDSMIIYTDGVVERPGRATDQSLTSVLPELLGRSAEEMADAIMSWAATTADATRMDDAALMIVRALP
jgi:PAS domain S-box-containing protein